MNVTAFVKREKKEKRKDQSQHHNKCDVCV